MTSAAPEVALNAPRLSTRSTVTNQYRILRNRFGAVSQPAEVIVRVTLPPLAGAEEQNNFVNSIADGASSVRCVRNEEHRRHRFDPLGGRSPTEMPAADTRRSSAGARAG